MLFRSRMKDHFLYGSTKCYMFYITPLILFIIPGLPLSGTCPFPPGLGGAPKGDGAARPSRSSKGLGGAAGRRSFLLAGVSAALTRSLAALGRPRPPGSPGPSSPHGRAWPRENCLLGAGPGRPTPPGPRVPERPPLAPEGPDGRARCSGPLGQDPCPSPQRRHVLGVRETPRGQRAAERSPRGQLGHPGAPRSGQVR